LAWACVRATAPISGKVDTADGIGEVNAWPGPNAFSTAATPCAEAA